MIRDKTLVNFQDWVQPYPTEIREALTMSGWSGKEFANAIGVDNQTVYRWTREDKDGGIVYPINYMAWSILCCKAGLGEIWDKNLS